MARNLHVVRFPGSLETEHWLQERLAEARDGELIGIAAITMYSYNNWGLAIRGETRKCPQNTRSYIPELDHLLAEIVRGR